MTLPIFNFLPSSGQVFIFIIKVSLSSIIGTCTRTPSVTRWSQHLYQDDGRRKRGVFTFYTEIPGCGYFRTGPVLNLQRECCYTPNFYQRSGPHLSKETCIGR